MRPLLLGLLLVACAPAPPRMAMRPTGRMDTVPGFHAHLGRRCPIHRDAEGQITRSREVKHLFDRLTGYPGGRVGYVRDHNQPLCDSGCDSVWNIQWQRADSARMKDKLEAKACKVPKK